MKNKNSIHSPFEIKDDNTLSHTNKDMYSRNNNCCVNHDTISIEPCYCSVTKCTSNQHTYNYADLGLNIKINASDENTQIDNLLTKQNEIPESELRCAIIQNETEQHVIWWVLETNSNSWLSSYAWYLAISKNEQWTKTIIIDNVLANNFWAINGVQQNGFNGNYPIRLFSYTNKKPGEQNKHQLYKTAQCIAYHLNKRTIKLTKLVVRNNRLFYHDVDVVWSTLITEHACISKLKKEVNDDFEITNFWKNNKSVIRKYYIPHSLPIRLAIMTNAPIEELRKDHHTPKNIAKINLKRNTP